MAVMVTVNSPKATSRPLCLLCWYEAVEVCTVVSKVAAHSMRHFCNAYAIPMLEVSAESLQRLETDLLVQPRFLYHCGKSLLRRKS